MSGWWSSRVIAWKVTARPKLWVWFGHHSCEEVSMIFQAGTLPAPLYWDMWVFIFLTKESILLKTHRFLWECLYHLIFFLLPPEEKEMHIWLCSMQSFLRIGVNLISVCHQRNIIISTRPSFIWVIIHLASEMLVSSVWHIDTQVLIAVL